MILITTNLILRIVLMRLSKISNKGLLVLAAQKKVYQQMINITLKIAYVGQYHTVQQLLLLQQYDGFAV